MDSVVSHINLIVYALIFLAALTVYVFLLKTAIFSWYDPLFIYVILNSFAIAFVTYLYFIENSINVFYYATFLISTLFFVLGILFGNRRFRRGQAQNDMQINYTQRKYSAVLDIILDISLVILLAANILLFAVKGEIPILSSNPSEAKVLLYTGGFGIVRRINFTLLTVTTAIIFLKLFHPSIKVKKRKKFSLHLKLFLVFLIVISQAGKGSLLIFITVLFYVMMINRLYKNYVFVRRINKSMIAIFCFAVLYMVLVVYLSHGKSPLLQSIITRFVSAGDVFYFFYSYDIFARFNYNLFDFLYRSLNPLLGMLRVADYEQPIGSLVLFHSIGMKPNGFGPNSQHYIEGLLFFGKYFFWLYSFAIGYIIAFTRTGLLIHIKKRPNQLNFLFYIVFSSMILSIATESSYFLLTFYDTLLCLTPIIVISLIAYFVIKINRPEVNCSVR